MRTVCNHSCSAKVSEHSSPYVITTGTNANFFYKQTSASAHIKCKFIPIHLMCFQPVFYCA